MQFISLPSVMSFLIQMYNSIFCQKKKKKKKESRHLIVRILFFYLLIFTTPLFFVRLHHNMKVWLHRLGNARVRLIFGVIAHCLRWMIFNIRSKRVLRQNQGF